MKELLRVNMHKQVRDVFEDTLLKAYDYLDCDLGKEKVSFTRIDLDLELDAKEEYTSKEEMTKILKNVNYKNTIVGIDHFEDHFDSAFAKVLLNYFFQSIVTTKEADLIADYPYHIQALYKDDVIEESDTTLRLSHNQYDKTMLLVEGKYDVAWYEKALKLLNKYQDYRVIPCGGYGNIPYVKEQLNKAGFKTIIVTDGDTKQKTSLKREIIELYADVDFVNQKFHTDFRRMPTNKWRLFKSINAKDDVIKKVLSSWAKNHLSKDSEFVQELDRKLS
jgi:hypothetical protein